MQFAEEEFFYLTNTLHYIHSSGFRCAELLFDEKKNYINFTGESMDTLDGRSENQPS